jgi:hypothetical protein
VDLYQVIFIVIFGLVCFTCGVGVAKMLLTDERGDQRSDAEKKK